jgi:iron-sulfur cluster repair protein YtfE (RIC family)
LDPFIGLTSSPRQHRANDQLNNLDAKIEVLKKEAHEVKSEILSQVDTGNIQIANVHKYLQTQLKSLEDETKQIKHDMALAMVCQNTKDWPTVINGKRHDYYSTWLPLTSELALPKG